MSGSRSNPAERHFAEQHLGDRLAALVDGELSHDARERVLAHLATCPKCKTEADAQRRLKSVFAQTAPPPPSESFLARLQSLPASDLDDFDDIGRSGGPRSPVDEGFATGSSESTGLPGGGVFTVSGGRPLAGYLPSGAHAAVLPSEQRGFRIHDVGRPEAVDRGGWRGRRFAFAAAGAVSLAAIALGGVTVNAPVATGEQRGGANSNSNATSPRSQNAPATGVPESLRRRGNSPFSAQAQRPPRVLAPTAAAVPLLAGAGAPAGRTPQQVTASLLAGAGVLSPLVRAVAPDAEGGATRGLTLSAADSAPIAPPSAYGPVRGASRIH
ncbi:zf-HC2 domain-containing protein [Streptomyces sp. G45]|uniref:anti-sigma factor family protein n=1 Tax=Streptomyces sp. G45 TaxID=3406627 RepID=UPI003C21B870